MEGRLGLGENGVTVERRAHRSQPRSYVWVKPCFSSLALAD